MKRIFLTFLIAKCTVLPAITPNEIAAQKPESVSEYAASDQFKTLKLPMTYAKALIMNASDKTILMNNEIVQIDLVYSRFKVSSTFDQRELNEKRIAELLEILPELKTKIVIWKLVEQTKGDTRNEAYKLYHGFVIHYHKKIDYKSLDATLKNYQVPFVSYTIDNQKDDTLTYDRSGSRLYFTANSGTYKNGQTVKGKIVIMYREFRNQVDILFSGIPMTTEKDGEKVNFNSGGMFEMKGFKNGVEIVLSKAIKVDFIATNMIPGMNYYNLGSGGGNSQWNFDKNLVPANAKSKKVNYKQTLVTKHYTRKYELEKEEKIKLHVPNFVTITSRNFKWGYSRVVSDTVDEDKASNARLNNQNMIAGLSSPNFGVYNCDQTYRMTNPVTIKAKFVEKGSKKNITQQYLLYVMDLNYNGAFNFSPQEFSCASKGKNVLVLFTEQGKIYVLSEMEFKKMNIKSNGNYTFQMTDMSSKIKSGDDLKKYLKI